MSSPISTADTKSGMAVSRMTTLTSGWSWRNAWTSLGKTPDSTAEAT
ncbi:hypothetical protein GBP346_A0981 [Burkholderia pseudomallei MSHR346]|nr:hypothetical protein GBP346_A0981 [Burkholderia pseudomallei MSHR346]